MQVRHSENGMIEGEGVARSGERLAKERLTTLDLAGSGRFIPDCRAAPAAARRSAAAPRMKGKAQTAGVGDNGGAGHARRPE
jgi:hypothetical protein